jgi:AraC-like DNA-binding protein
LGKPTQIELNAAEREAKNRRARQIVERLDLTPAELQRLLEVLRVALDTLDPDYRANVAAIARHLGKSRRTIYHWTDRVLAVTVQELRKIRVGRPSKRGRM